MKQTILYLLKAAALTILKKITKIITGKPKT